MTPAGLDFKRHTVRFLVQQVISRRITAQELVDTALGVIQRLDPVLNPFTSVDSELALQHAARIDRLLDAGGRAGPLAGIPIAVKDLEAAAGFETSYGSYALATGMLETKDSVLVRRLKNAGAVVIGKTNTPEIGWKGFTDNLRFGPTRNPWGISRTCGGSSGGSAVAVASGMVPLATGSDGGGSIRIPSAWCGISAFKPSYDAIPVAGPGPSLAWGELSSKGVIGRCIDDIVTSYSVASSSNFDREERSSDTGLSESPWVRSLEGRMPKRIAWCRALGGFQPSTDTEEACTRALASLEARGVVVEEVGEVLPEETLDTWITLTSAYNSRAVIPLRKTPAWDLLDPELVASVLSAYPMAQSTLIEAENKCRRYSVQLERLLVDYDLLVTPTCAVSPPVLGTPALDGGHLNVRYFPYSHQANLTGSPAASVFAGLDDMRMPVGLQLIGSTGADSDVLRFALAVEGVLGLARIP